MYFLLGSAMVPGLGKPMTQEGITLECSDITRIRILPIMAAITLANIRLLAEFRSAGLSLPESNKDIYTTFLNRYLNRGLVNSDVPPGPGHCFKEIGSYRHPRLRI